MNSILGKMNLGLVNFHNPPPSGEHEQPQSTMKGTEAQRNSVT